MSSTVDLKEFLTAYLAEADEQLTLANRYLLEIEASLKKGAVHPRAVRDLFRALHTIKGLSAMVGIEPIVAIAHRMESALRSADKTGGVLHAAAVDTLLMGVRAIEQRVRALSEGKEISPPPAALLEALDGLEPAAAAPAPAARGINLDAALKSKLAPFELDSLEQSGGDGRRAIRADFVPSPARADNGFSINSVRDRLASIAEIIKVIPVTIPRTPEAPGGLSFVLLMLTSAEDADVAAAVGIDPSEVVPLACDAAPESTPDLEAASALLPLPEDDGDVESSAVQRRNIVRVDVARLDDAMEQLSALIVTRSRLTRAVAAMTDAGVSTRELGLIVKDNSRQLRDLRAAILRVRMVPLAEVLDRVPLIVRGLRRETRKQVRLSIDARNAELDKSVAERIFPAIVHIIRNAMDHAIEAPDDRTAAGKPREATLRIACSARSNTRLELTIADDGRGVDRAAVERRIGRDIGPGDGALLDALCQAGVSTRTPATTTSGRGMGMEIVKRVIVDQLGGELLMKTEAGRGTTFTIRVPLTIAIVDAFTLDCCGHSFVVPVSVVEEILDVDAERIVSGPFASSKADALFPGFIERRGETVPLLHLGAALHLEAPLAPPRRALLVRRNGEPMAFGVDNVRAQHEAVVRPLTDPLVQVPGVSGATDLGDGKPTLVLDLISLGATLLTGTRLGERAA